MAVTFNNNERHSFREEIAKRLNKEKNDNAKKRARQEVDKDAYYARLTGKSEHSAQERYEHWSKIINDPSLTGAEARIAFREQQRAQLEMGKR